MSSKKHDSNENSELVEREKSPLEAMTTMVNGKTLFDLTEEIKNTWAVSTLARLKVGRLLCTIVDNEMLKSADLIFSEYVAQFGIKVSLAYLLMRIWRDTQVRQMVEDGLPLQAADSMIGIGSKYGAEYRQELVDYAVGNGENGGTKNTRALRIRAQEIRRRAKDDKKPTPEPMGPQDELRAALAIERMLKQQKDLLLGKIKEIDAKIGVNNAEVRRLTEICKALADDARPEPEPINATKAAVILAEKHDVDLANMKGSLANDRIAVRDVREEIESMKLDEKAKAKEEEEEFFEIENAAERQAEKDAGII